ncbi:MAG: hypothetical protein ACMUIG_02790 [Thermoplasmatota archaeon]
MTEIIRSGSVLSSTASDLTDSLMDNIVVIVIVLTLAILIIAGLRTWDVIDNHLNLVKRDELESKHEKLKRYAAHQKRKALRDAIVMLKPDERSRLYEIWSDNSIVSRKALFRLNELEERTRRAERATEVKWAEGKLDELRMAENKLFGEGGKKG